VELDRLQRRGEGAAELLAELRQRFGAQAVTSIDARRVRIAVRPRAEGLTVPSGWETLETSWVGGGSEALELELPPPFDPTAGPYSFELGLRGIAGQSAGLFEFEVLGFSLVHDGRGGWWAGTLAGAADAAGRIAAARAGAAEGPVESAVEGGRARVLRVECDRSRGGLRAYLDGRQVVRFDGAPSDLGGALRLRLRSSAPVELSTLEVEGPLR
jgi:hypothetical protein